MVITQTLAVITSFTAIAIIVSLAFMIINMFKDEDKMPRKSRKIRSIFNDDDSNILSRLSKRRDSDIDSFTSFKRTHLNYRLKQKRKPKRDMFKIVMKVAMAVIPIIITLSVASIVIQEVYKQLPTITQEPINTPINVYDEYPIPPDESKVLNTENTLNNVGNTNYTDIINKYKINTVDTFDNLGTLDLDMNFGVI